MTELPPAHTIVRGTSQPWAMRADELLADGAWHEGLTVIREAEKRIIPGVAMRYMDRIREKSAREKGRDKPYNPDLSVAAQIQAGKIKLMRVLFSNRMACGSWETNPAHVPMDMFLTREWQLRDLRRQQRSIAEIAHFYHLSKGVILGMLLSDPPVPYTELPHGRYVHVDHLPVIAAKVKVYEAGRFKRRSIASTKSRAVANRITAEDPPTQISMRQARALYGFDCTIATRIVQDNPDLGWVRKGRYIYIPVDLLPDVEAAVKADKAGGFGRRSGSQARRHRAKIDAAPTETNPAQPEESDS